MSSEVSASLPSLILSALAASQLVTAITPSAGGDCFIFPLTDTVLYHTDVSPTGKRIPFEYNGEKTSAICTTDAASGKTFRIGLLSEDGTQSHCILPGYSGNGVQTIWFRDANGEGRQSVDLITDKPLSPEEVKANHVASTISLQEAGSLCSDSKCTSALTCLEADTITSKQVSQVEANTAKLRNEIENLGIEVKHDEL